MLYVILYFVILLLSVMLLYSHKRHVDALEEVHYALARLFNVHGDMLSELRGHLLHLRRTVASTLMDNAVKGAPAPVATPTPPPTVEAAAAQPSSDAPAAPAPVSQP